jgi:predicted Zn-dependent protease
MPTFSTSVRITALGLAVSIAGLGAQTVITAPKNNYSPAEDVELGRQAAAEVEKQLPMLRDDQVSSPISSLGNRLVGAIPEDLRHSEFRYSFQVVNVREINAFALPGGPMYVNRGMIEAAKTEGEVAGVMAHELAHVALRRGTSRTAKSSRSGSGRPNRAS